MAVVQVEVVEAAEVAAGDSVFIYLVVLRYTTLYIWLPYIHTKRVMFEKRGL